MKAVEQEVTSEEKKYSGKALMKVIKYTQISPLKLSRQYIWIKM